MIKNLILFVHLLVVSYLIFYRMCVNNKKYDHIYILLIYFILLHWTFLKGECILGYSYKKLENKDYKFGLNNTNDDFDCLFGCYKIYFCILIYISIIINIFFIGSCNNIKKYYLYIYIFIYTFYLCGRQCYNNRNINANFQLFNDIIKILLIFFGIYFYRNNRIFFTKQ
jgi:hypothetical protein